MDIKEAVKDRYSRAALRVVTGGSSCCGAEPAAHSTDPISANLYDAKEKAQLPDEAVTASLGCGNPTA